MKIYIKDKKTIQISNGTFICTCICCGEYSLDG